MSKDPIATHLEVSLAALQRATHDAPSDYAPVIQQIHLAVAHGICDEIERAMMRQGPPK